MKPIRPFEPYKIDQLFGVPVSYGPHEGVDYNGLNGGNTDCGTPYLAAWDGEVVFSSSSTSGYGKLVVLRVVLSKSRTLYIRYCHCSEFVVTSGLVKRGDVIAKMGSSGNSTACHLHLDILTKIPPNWRFYAKTQSELDEWFLDPEHFFSDTIETDMASWLVTLLKEDLGIDTSKSEGEIRGKVGDIKNALNGYESLRKRVETLEEDLIAATKESEGTKMALELETENRMRVENELRDLKVSLSTKDTEIRKLEDKVASLEAQQALSTPQTGNILSNILNWLLKRN